jgi:hypothetical protein
VVIDGPFSIRPDGRRAFADGYPGLFQEIQTGHQAGVPPEAHFPVTAVPLLQGWLGATTAPLRHDPPAAEPEAHTAAAMEPVWQSTDCAELPALH